MTRVVLVVTVHLIAFGFAPPQKRTANSEHEVKAVFLFNFAQFVEWPSKSLPEPNSPIVIGILGKDPFGVYLEETIKDETVNGHPLVIERYTDPAKIKNCQILFITAGKTTRFDTIIKALKGRDILTVSDGNNFAKQGGMIRFITENNRIRLRINLKAVKASGITISSKLLQLSEIVD